MKRIDKKNIKEIVSLTSVQEGMLFHYIKEPNSNHYFEQLILSLSGKIQLEFFNKAWEYVVLNNESLRTIFHWENLEKPVQIVLKKHYPDLIYFDLSILEKENKVIGLEKIIQEDRQKIFDLRNVPFRICLCKLSRKDYRLIISNHHILYDGWSNGILFKEFFEAYTILEERGTLPTSTVKPTLSKFIRWIQSQEQGDQQKFWGNYLYGFTTPASIPIKKELLEQGNSGKGNEVQLVIKKGLKERFDYFLKERHFTFATFFYCAWGILLQKYCDCNDVVFGTTVSGRSAPIDGIERMIGLFINTIPLRINTEPGEKIVELLERINNSLILREEFENTSLVNIKEYSEFQNEQSLFDTIIVLENYPLDPHFMQENSGLPIRVSSYSIIESTPYPLTVSITAGEMIEIRFIFDTQQFESNAILNLSAHFNEILINIVENYRQDLRGIEIVTEKEKSEILGSFNNTIATYPFDNMLHQLFVQQVDRTPFKVALVGLSEEISTPNELKNYYITISYTELDKRSDLLASTLVEQGVGSDNVIGIKIERSVEMVIGLLGILKSGGAYMPLDPDYPRERIDFMIKDSDAKFLITINNFLNTSKLSILKHFNLHLSTASSLAYVIYTSGTTGKPKGSLIEHRNVVSLMLHENNLFNFTNCDVWTMFHSYCFDFSVWEMYGALLYGGRLVIITRMIARDPKKYLNLLKKERVTILNQTPAAFYQLSQIEIECRSNYLCLRYIIFGGEALTPNKLKLWQEKYPETKLINMFGITETTVHVTYKELTKDNIHSCKSNIGKSLPTLVVYIMNKCLTLLPKGLAGELCVGGLGVSRGYLNRPGLTSEKFIGNPFFPKQKLYRSGDLGKWSNNGEIEYLGRIDHQVKIRGFRIELGEIENRLLKFPGINDVLVHIIEKITGDKLICAYIVADREYKLSEIRDFLIQEVPEYMIPSYAVYMKKFPLTSNGKVDRRALPKPEFVVSEIFLSPRNKIEEKLAEIWSVILGIEKEKISITDNFFHLGGHSLKATILVSKIHKELNVNVPLSEIFKKSNIRDLAGLIKDLESQQFFSIESVEKKEYYILSSAQRRLFVLHRMDLQGIAYNMPSVWQLEGSLDMEKFATVFQQLIQRHESLRTSFYMVNDEPVQRIHEEVSFEIIHQHATVDGAVTNPDSFIHPFELGRAPLLRVGLIEPEGRETTEGSQYVNSFLIIDMHHIISDGMSTMILLREFMELYSGKEQSRLRLQYKDYSEWQCSQRRGKVFKQQEVYWLKEFSGEIPELNLPLDYPRPEIQSFDGNSIDFGLDKNTTIALKTLVADMETTMYMVLLAVYNIFLFCLSGQEDIIVGTPVAGRGHADLEGIIGMFVNTLALRNFLKGEKTFRGFLSEVRERTLLAFENQDYPYEELVNSVALKRDAGRNPLFDTMYTLQNFDNTNIEISVLELFPYKFKNKASKFDLSLSVVEKNDELFFTFGYSTLIFKEQTICRFSDYFTRIISSVISDSCLRIADIGIISEQEKSRILFEFNDSEVAIPYEKTIHCLFEEQAKRTVNCIAVVGQSIESKEVEIFSSNHSYMDCALTYNELSLQSAHLSLSLIEKGVGRGTIVGLIIERSVEMIIGIMSILKAGGAYLPIDPNTPDQRKRYILRESGTRILLTQSEIVRNNSRESNKFNFNFTSPHLKMSLKPTASSAYVLYTSGSTGKPKGVIITHRNLVNLVYGMKEVIYRYEKPIFVALVSPLYFDASVKQIFPTVIFGHKLVITSDQERVFGEKLVQFYVKHSIIVSDGTPAHLSLILDALKFFRSNETFPIRKFVIGGEILKSSLVESLLSNINKTIGQKEVEIFNVYGPTECCDVSTTFNVTVGRLKYKGNIPIGKPINNTNIYIMRDMGIVQPIGVAGEMYIGGYNVSEGYINQPELTTEKFIHPQIFTYLYKSIRKSTLPSPLTHLLTYSTLYRTGDLARWFSDGNIEFLGRIDYQVKIRGYRIELEEIENCLLRIDGIKEAVAVVLKKENLDQLICAYFVSQYEFGNIRLKEYLSKELPDYMIPSFFVGLEKMPLTSNGKVDKRALPEPVVAMNGKTEPIKPRDKMENKLTDIWADVLGIEQSTIGIDDNFFYLGGHSLKATVIISKIFKEFHVKIPLAEIFRTPTIRELTNYIKGTKPEAYMYIRWEEEKEFYPASYTQKRMWLLCRENPSASIFYMIGTLTLRENVVISLIEKILNRLIQRHDGFRTSFKLIKNQLVQVVNKNIELRIIFRDISFMQPLEKEIKAREIFDEEVAVPFDLSQMPLFRAILVKWTENHFELIFNMHHIISDGWSLEILKNEFGILYDAYTRGLPYNMKPLTHRYRDYSTWQNRLLENKKIITDSILFWKDYLSGGLPVLNLPYDYNTHRISKASSSYRWVITEELALRLKELAHEQKASLFLILLAGFYIMLYQVTHQEDIILAIPAAARQNDSLRNIMGFFVNTLIIRNRVTPVQTFTDFFTKLKSSTLEILDHQDIPLELICSELKIKYPMINVFFNMINIGTSSEVYLSDLQKCHRESVQDAKFDIVCYVNEYKNGIEINCHYFKERFKPATCETLMELYERILINIVIDKNKTVKEYTSPSNKKKLKRTS